MENLKEVIVHGKKISWVLMQEVKDENKLLCSQCHAACNSSCNGAGPKNCVTCAEGWYMVEEQGCFDINECLESDESCPGNQFCVNKEGGYTCLDSDLLGRKKQENLARYATYLGLCIATCIILQRNIYAASVIGILVATYISVSEYMIAHSNIQDTTANMNVLKPS
ncbi:hypothetical protein KPH14_009894 [Odynerus spinipes]|uniref:NOTCH1 EGF-like calcium-binding domain-containing protein n=1 Tax=Odynerus spinipes TaxID=1348599 RepID=A0AAD9VT55_9HYME|nr:hypothetical protein KPH14_009894 [Odynerus spinipes]